MKTLRHYIALLQPLSLLVLLIVIVGCEALADTLAGFLTMFGLVALAGLMMALGRLGEYPGA